MHRLFLTCVLAGWYLENSKLSGLQAVVQYVICLCRNIWSADDPVEPVECFVPTKVIRVHNMDKPAFNDDCR